MLNLKKVTFMLTLHCDVLRANILYKSLLFHNWGCKRSKFWKGKLLVWDISRKCLFSSYVSFLGAKWRIVSSFDMTSIFYGEKLEILKLPFTNFFSIRLKAFQFPSGVSWGIYFQERREECQKWEIVGMSPLFL